MPVYHYCPLCAAELITRQMDARPRQVCPVCGFIYYENPVPAAGCLVEQEGRVLMVQRKYPPYVGGWTLPAGFIEYDETPEQAAVREMGEETGLEVRLTGLFGVFPWYQEFKDGQAHENGVLIVYRGTITGGELRPGDDAQTAGWFGADELPEFVAFSSHRDALAIWGGD